MEGVKHMNTIISDDRKEYLSKKRRRKRLILITQILTFIIFIALWELLANLGVIDSFLMSSPSRIVKTILDMSSNNLITHLSVTCLETIVGFLLGTIIGALLACILW